MNTLFQSEAISVSALNAKVRGLLETNLTHIWVSGEVSNLTRAASGHYYFNLKDESAQVRCALFKGYASKLSSPLTEGAQVELTGKFTLYEARGEYQITVTDVRFSGLGRLFEAFEKLKAKLLKEGLFEGSRKKTLPRFPKKIGIITSPAAAALKDVLTTLKRRLGKRQVVLYPTPVQGLMSENSIARAINIATERDEVDVLIVCRGGGSIEDLWAFNEEIVARAIASSHLPIISGVGHETDFTIADFVADMRAPTPTAAAELVSFDRNDLIKKFEQYQYTLRHFMMRSYESNSQYLDNLSRLLIHPKDQISRQKQQLIQYKKQLYLLLNADFKEKRYRLAVYSEKLPNVSTILQFNQTKLGLQQKQLNHNVSSLIRNKQEQLNSQLALLNAVAPQKVLERGYAIVKNKQNHVINSSKQTRAYEKLDIIFSDGQLEVNVAEENMTQEQLPF